MRCRRTEFYTEERMPKSNRTVVRRLLIAWPLTLVILCAFTGRLEAQGTAADAVARALAVHGPQLVSGGIVDSSSTGKVTLFNAKGPVATFEVTILRKGRTRLQRTIKQPSGNLRQGTDGARTWDSFGVFTVSPARSRALNFVESQTVRSIENLFDHNAAGLLLRDLGTVNNARIIEAEDRQARKTRFSIDASTSVITQVQAVTGDAKKAALFNTDTYVLSDYRRVQGILTPFRIVRYIGGSKVEEMLFSSVSYNAAVPDSAFKP